MIRRHVDFRYFFIALVPVVIFAQEAMIAENFFDSDLQIPVKLVEDEQSWMEAAGRFRFLAATWFFIAFVVLVVAILLRDLMQPMTSRTRGAAFLVLMVIVMVAMTPTVMIHFNPEGPRVYDHLGTELFEAVLARGALPGCDVPDDRWLLGRCGETPVLSMFDQVINVVNVFAGLGVGALIVGMILCLESTEQANLKNRQALAQRNLQRMRRQLYLSGLLLSFGMFFAVSWMHWPVQLIDGSGQDAFKTLIRAYALHVGVYFSLLILGFYLPVALILESRVQKLTEEVAATMKSDQAFNSAKWRSENGLATEQSEVIRSGLALAAPILTAFTGGISPLSLG